jgi:hypothetical protein
MKLVGKWDSELSKNRGVDRVVCPVLELAAHNMHLFVTRAWPRYRTTPVLWKKQVEPFE